MGDSKPNETCSRYLPIQPAKCVFEDHNRSCKKKWPGKITFGTCYGNSSRKCLCSLCGRNGHP